ncbi:MAG: TrkH family potassium uptake protein [Clostridiales bacterium]|jgi:trk system potassium uptake protein TrkH|nr:TrkH family potassium uptake protein [Clostridiales bacterium]
MKEKKNIIKVLRPVFGRIESAVGTTVDRISRGNVYGKLIILIGFLELMPVVITLFYPSEIRYAPWFVIPSFSAIALGIIIGMFTKQAPERTDEWQAPIRRGSFPVLFAWGFAIFLGSIPFFLGGIMDFLPALFESVSGWTTTGLSLADVESLPHIYLFFRSFMQYGGGLGFILMVNMLIHGKQEINLFNAEGHPDRIMPNLKKTSQTIFLLYNGFLLAGIISYAIFGMSFFDALCHAMSALSTAGFSTRADSIGAYGNIGIELVTIVLMLVGATNFAILLLLVKGKIRRVLGISEIRFMLAMTLVFSLLIAASLVMDGNGVGESLHNAFFGVITAFSTTGYTIANYAEWNAFAVFLIFILMFIGGGAGSTAGGIKIVRVHVLFKSAVSGVIRRLFPSNKVISLSYYKVQGKSPIDGDLVSETLGFFFSYIAIFMLGTALILLFSPGTDVQKGAFEFASALGTVGISNGLTKAANYPTLIVEMFGMVLGRLEIFIVFVGIFSAVSRLKKFEFKRAVKKNKKDKKTKEHGSL